MIRWHVFSVIAVVLMLVSGVSEATECVRQKLTFARHADVPLSEAKIDKLLQGASLVLQTKDSVDDVACCVEFVRVGPVSVFGKPGDKADDVKNADELRKVWHINRQTVKVVKSLSLGSFLGIEGTPVERGGQTYPRLTIVLVNDQAPEVLAHEFGHYKSILLHNNSSPANLMHESENGKVITASECRAFQADGERFQRE